MIRNSEWVLLRDTRFSAGHRSLWAETRRQDYDACFDHTAFVRHSKPCVGELRAQNLRRYDSKPWEQQFRAAWCFIALINRSFVHAARLQVGCSYALPRSRYCSSRISLAQSQGHPNPLIVDRVPTYLIREERVRTVRSNLRTKHHACLLLVIMPTPDELFQFVRMRLCKICGFSLVFS